MNSDPRCHGFGVSKEGVEAEGVLLQVFPLDVSKAWLVIIQSLVIDYIYYRTPTITADRLLIRSIKADVTELHSLVENMRTGPAVKTEHSHL